MFPWHNTRDKAKTVHSYEFIHLLPTHRKTIIAPVDSSLFFFFFGKIRIAAVPERKLNNLHTKKVKKKKRT